ncbi:MAG: DEAD/DEAH box helicase, partial [Frisingicoccus sp.]|uniref:DEAD/DEAH box helicase n=1 Tax=Frisingicoccus sp. TaxID=1918627 RepID=UPI002613A27C
MEKVLFENLEISKEIKRAIRDMGFEEATPVQAQSIGPIMEGRDVVAQAPTGTGKTCAFGIPLIEGIDIERRNVQALILCPTRELVVQTTDELMKLIKYKHSIRVVPIYGGQNMDRQIMALKRKPQIIVATPGRLMDHMRRHTIRLEHLEYMVLDEADEMLNMGFREDIDKILESVPEERQTVLFSA